MSSDNLGHSAVPFNLQQLEQQALAAGHGLGQGLDSPALRQNQNQNQQQEGQGGLQGNGSGDVDGVRVVKQDVGVMAGAGGRGILPVGRMSAHRKLSLTLETHLEEKEEDISLRGAPAE